MKELFYQTFKLYICIILKKYNFCVLNIFFCVFHSLSGHTRSSSHTQWAVAAQGRLSLSLQGKVHCLPDVRWWHHVTIPGARHADTGTWARLLMASISCNLLKFHHHIINVYSIIWCNIKVCLNAWWLISLETHGSKELRWNILFLASHRYYKCGNEMRIFHCWEHLSGWKPLLLL